MFKEKYFSLPNKLVLITGASSGIGQATAKAFAKQNARLALTARNKEKLATLKREISNEGIEVEIFPFNLLKVDNIAELVRQIEEHFKDTVDILVNSAGIAILGMVENVPIEAYERNMQLNFFAPLRLIKSVITGMKDKQSGQIINLFSGVGKRGLPGVSAYCVSKFALNGLAESLRVEVSRHNIDVIMVSPGLVRTNFIDNSIIYGRLKETFTSGKFVNAEFVADKIVGASLERKRDVILSRKTSLGIYLNYLFPSILDKILTKKL